jgi:hypothetical protein
MFHGRFFVNGVEVLPISIFSIEGGIYMISLCFELEPKMQDLVQQMRKAGLPETLGRHEVIQFEHIEIEIDQYILSGLRRLS